MNKSNTIKQLAEALAKAQAEMPVVKMNATNPFLKNNFADLGAVIDASRPTLAKYGMSLSQFPTSDGDKIGITNVLMHSSGEWLEDTVYLSLADEKGKSAAQAAGSVITYLRRYSWAAMLGLYADEDTDGHTPAKREAKPQRPAAEQSNGNGKTEHAVSDIRKQHNELWKQATSMNLLNKETVSLWSIKASDNEETVQGKVALITAAIGAKVTA